MKENLKNLILKKKLNEKTPKYGKRKLSVGLISCILAFSMFTPFLVNTNMIKADTVAEQPEPASKTWEGIELPKEVALSARPLNQVVTKDEVENAIKQAIQKANNNIDMKSIAVNVVEQDSDSEYSNDLTKFNEKFTADNGVYRKSQYWTFNGATITYNKKTSSAIPVTFLSYALPFWAHNNGQILDKNINFNNQDKIRVTDANNYLLSDSQQNEIKNKFITINKANNSEFPVLDKDITVDNKGNLTFNDKFGNEIKIPSGQIVSVFPIIDEVVMFSKKTDDGKGWITNGKYNREYKLKDGVSLKKFCLIQNTQNADPQGKSADNGVLPADGTMFGMGVSYDNENNKIIISGTMNFEAASFNKYVKTLVDGEDGYYRDVSNRIVFRTISVKEPETFYRDVDDENEKIKKAELEAQLQVDKVGTTGSDGNENQKAQKVNEIKNKVTKELTDEEFKKVQHDTKGFYTAKGKLKYKENENAKEYESAEIPVKVRYYTKKFQVLVQNPNSLTEEEKTAIKKAAAKANGLDENSLDKVTLSDDGTVKIKFNDGKKEKEIDLGKNHVVTAKYDDKEVVAKPGTTQTSEIKPSDTNYKFPSGTTFTLPSGEGVTNPDGITVDENGKVTYKVPEKFAFGPNETTKEITGKILVKLPDQEKQVEVPYKFKVEKEAAINIKYVYDKTKFQSSSASNNQTTEIPTDAKLDGQEYPVTAEGQKNTDYDSSNVNKNNAPKFLGYKFEMVGALGTKKFKNPASDTVYFVYNKLDDIVSEPANKNDIPAGYVKVTFKDIDGVKVGNSDKDKVFYVNPKAGVKISDDGKHLVGKTADGSEQKVVIPDVTADSDENQVVENGDKKWKYSDVEAIGQEITEAKEFTPQVNKICLAPDSEQANFETAINSMFANVGSKDGVYKGSYDKNKKEVTVKILDKDKKFTEISGTGLVSGLIKLYNENHLVKVKVGDQEERDLKAIASAATTNGLKVDQTFKQIFGSDVGNAIQSTGEKTGTLKDFIDKEVTLKLTVQEKDACKEIVLEYKIKGIADDNVKYDPKAEDITKEFGTKTTKEEVVGKVSVPDYPEDAVKKPTIAVKDESKLPNGTQAGEFEVPVTVTYPDGTTEDINVKVTVKEDTVLKLKDPEKTKVNDLTKLTEDEKTKVKEAVKKANKDLNLQDSEITVAEDGKVTVTRGNKKGEIAKEKTVEEDTVLKLKDPEKTKVNDLTKLTEDEKTKVKEAVKKANEDLNLQDSEITVAEDGKVTVTRGNKKGEIVKEKTVEEDTVLKLKDPEKTKVNDLTKLTEDEKTKVKEAVKKANEDLNLQDSEITVAEDGKVTVTRGNKKGEIVKEKTVEKKSSTPSPKPQPQPKPQPNPSVPGNNGKNDNNGNKGNNGNNANNGNTGSNGENNGENNGNVNTQKPQIKAPDKKVKVKDPNKLTKEEKQRVEKEIRDKNKDLPKDSKVEISDNGDVVVKDKDNKVIGKLNGKDLIEKKKKIATEKNIKKKLPKTNVEGTSLVYTILSGLSLLAFKRRKRK